MFHRDPAAATHAGVRHVQPPHPISEAGYLDRVDVLTIDGRVLDAGAWNVQRLIWPPDFRLEGRDVDAGPRSGNLYLGPGGRSSAASERATGEEMTFVQPLTNRAIISASLPTKTVELVLRASSPADTGPRSMRVDVDGRPAGQSNLSGADGYRDITIAIPEDPSRPPVSEITLHFDSRRPRQFRVQTGSADDQALERFLHVRSVRLLPGHEARRVLSPIFLRPSSGRHARVRGTALRGGQRKIGATRRNPSAQFSTEADVRAPCVETIRRPAGRVRTSSVPAGRQTDRFGALAVRTSAPSMIKSG